jgi:hypothetical protein
MSDPKRDLEKRVAELQDDVQRLRDALVAIHAYATPREGGSSVLDKIAQRAERALNKQQVSPGPMALASLPFPSTSQAPPKTTPSGSGSRRRRR